MQADSMQANNGLSSLSRGDSLITYFRDKDEEILISEADAMWFLDEKYRYVQPEQQLYSKLHYNQIYISKSTTETVDGIRYKHQSIVARPLFTGDSLLIVHEPGTGKTISQLYAMMLLLEARIINKIFIINGNSRFNATAIVELAKMYESTFKRYFNNLAFGTFRRSFIRTITMRQMATTKYGDNVGIIIDEAHGLVSEDALPKDDKPEKKQRKRKAKDENTFAAKVKTVDNFIANLAAHRGVKLILSTATPIFGTTASRARFGQILNRSLEKTDIPSSMISYVKINYSHLRVKMMHNEDYDFVEEGVDPEIVAERREYANHPRWLIKDDVVQPKHTGDWSFKMKNGVVYPFQLFISKPFPAQIADFSNLIAQQHEVEFGTAAKSIIVSPSPYEPAKPGEETDYSTILESILSALDKSIHKDGTVIIYSELKENGLKQIAIYLMKRGFTFYKKDNSSQVGSTNTMNREDKRAISTHRDRIAKIRDEIKAINEDFDDEEKSATILQGQLMMLNQRQDAYKNKHFDDKSIAYDRMAFDSQFDWLMEYEGKILAPFTAFVMEQQAREAINVVKRETIRQLEVEKTELEKMISEIRSRQTVEEARARSYSFTVYTSGADSEMLEMGMTQRNMTDGQKAFNSAENWDGSIVKIIIGSKIMRDGVDLKHAIQTHIVIPEWRISSFIQAHHRGIRSNGHDHIIHHRALKYVEEKRQSLKKPEERMKIEEAEELIREGKIDVEIYYHYIDMKLLYPEDVDEAMPYIQQAFTRINTDAPHMEKVKSEEAYEKWLEREEAFTANATEWLDGNRQAARLLIEVKMYNAEDIDRRANAMVNDGMFSLEEPGKLMTFEEAQRTAIIANSVFEMLQSDEKGFWKYQAGRSMYEKAREGYVTVGAEMMKLRSSAIDYRLNVREDDRVADAMDNLNDNVEYQQIRYRPEELLGKDDTDLFYANDYSEVIIKDIITRLLEYNWIRTDDLMEELLLNGVPEEDRDDIPLDDIETYSLLSKSLIATAIVELVDFRRFVYNPFLGIEMMVKLYTKKSESVLYLTTTDNDDHPYISHVESVGRSLTIPPKPVEIEILESDSKLPLTDSTLFSKLRYVLRKAMISRTTPALTPNEYNFMILLSNYWAFSWSDIEGEVQDRNALNVFLFAAHIDNANIHVFGKTPLTYQYSIKSDKWIPYSGGLVEKTYFTRYVSLVNSYRRFKFALEPDFQRYVLDAQRGEREYDDMNGIILFKGFMRPGPPMLKKSKESKDGTIVEQPPISFVDHFILPYETFVGKTTDHIIIKKFMDPNARGSQMSGLDKDKSRFDSDLKVIAELKRINDNEVTMMFFLYEHQPRGRLLDIIEFKKMQMSVMKVVMNGLRTENVSIDAVEEMFTDGPKDNDATRKKTLKLKELYYEHLFKRFQIKAVEDLEDDEVKAYYYRRIYAPLEITQ